MPGKQPTNTKKVAAKAAASDAQRNTPRKSVEPAEVSKPPAPPAAAASSKRRICPTLISKPAEP